MQFLRQSYSKVDSHSALLRLQSNGVSASSLMDFIPRDCWRVEESSLFDSAKHTPKKPDVRRDAFLFIVAQVEHKLTKSCRNNKNTTKWTWKCEPVAAFVSDEAVTGGVFSLNISFIFLA